MKLPAPPEFDDIRTEIRRLCDKYGNEYWRGLEPDRYPTEFVTELTTQGWLSALIPPEYGGGGLSLTGATVILEEIAASGGNPSACHAQMYVMGTLLRHGSDAQKQHYLPQIADGRLRLQAFGVTEPVAGSETTAIRTKAVRDGDTWRINGQKIWTSRAEHSDLMILLARTTSAEEIESRTDGLSVFLVEMRDADGELVPGLTINPIPTMMNHSTTEVFFDDVVIGADALIGTEGMGFRHILDGMNAERILIAAECIGDGRFFLERASAYANEREVFGRPIGTNQGCSSRWPGPMRISPPPTSCATAPPSCSTEASRAASRPTWPSSSPAKHPGLRATLRSTPTAGSASQSSTTSNASSARPGSTRWRRSTTT